jgi:hypothetical protein
VNARRFWTVTGLPLMAWVVTTTIRLRLLSESSTSSSEVRLLSARWRRASSARDVSGRRRWSKLQEWLRPYRPAVIGPPACRLHRNEGTSAFLLD